MTKGILPDSLSLRSKIYIYITAFLAALLIALWFIQVVFFEDIYQQVKRQEILGVSTDMEKVIRGEYPVEKLVKSAFDNEVCLIVFDEQMTQVQSLDGPRDCVIHGMNHDEQVEAVHSILKNPKNHFMAYERADETYRLVTYSSSSEFRLFRESNSPKDILYARRMTDNDGRGYIILVNAQGEPVESIINTTRMVLTIVTLFSMVCVWILIIFMAKGISDPIERINGKAKVLARGHYDIDFDGNGYKEINELSNTMNYAANELSKVEKLRREFIANVSHDLRTPLTMIGGYAEVMRDIPGENSPENAQVIIDETNRLASMVSDVLNLSKIQSGASKPDLQRYKLTDSIEQIVMNVTELLKSEDFEIKFEYDENVYVNADKTLINQCFYNLLANALSYSVDRREVAVKQTVNNGKVRISVTDFGKGIQPEDMPYIWERYYKNTENRVKNVKSSGLGLSIVKSFIVAHKGTCGVDSTPGKGSTFWFEIDIAQ